MSKRLSARDTALLRTQSPEFQRAFLDAQCRLSFAAFFFAAFEMLYPGKPLPTSAYVFAMLHKFEQMVTGDLKRLVCNLPPRHGKTEFGTVMLAAWILGRAPAAKVFVVSYGLQLSEKITGRIRQIIEHPHYKRIFPGTRLMVGHNRIGLFKTTKGGECMACSQESAVTGFGTQYMLVDDFQKADEAQSPVERENAIETFKGTFLSRFDNLGEGRILINQQRLHEDDLSGWAIRLGWERFCLPAIAVADEVYALPGGEVWQRKKGDLLDPVRVPLAYLDEQKLAQGFRFFSAQYQQDPDVSDGCLIDWDWFAQYDEPPEREELLYIVQSWDPAMTDRFDADYTVGMTWGYDGDTWYLLDLIRAQIRFPELVERVTSWHRRWRADALLIEGASIGCALYDQIRTKRLPGRLLNPAPRGSKEDRLAACTAQLATGNYALPAQAPWLEALRRELMAFPDGRNDDQVDALTQFLNFVFGRSGRFELTHDRNGRRIRSQRMARVPRRYPLTGPLNI